MIDRKHGLPIAKQVQALGISRGSVYYLPRSVPERDLAVMRRMDELHMNYPFAGARMLCGLLIGEDFAIGRKHVDTLRRKMGLSANYRKPNTSKPAPGHKTYPYLLRQTVERANQGLPMAKGFVHLAAVLDWHTRRVLSWGLSITMDTSFCIEAVKEALEKYGAPDIFNTDQGSQFSAQAFTRVLLDRNITISMDGRGAWRDTGIGNYFIFYNTKRPHQALDGNTPDAAYFTPQQLPAAA